MLQPRTQALSSIRRKDPGWGWSRGSQILGAKLKFCQGSGGRGVYCLYLKYCNFFLDSDDKIYTCDTKLGMEELSKIRICLYCTTSCEQCVLSNISRDKVDQISVHNTA